MENSTLQLIFNAKGQEIGIKTNLYHILENKFHLTSSIGELVKLIEVRFSRFIDV